MGYPSFKLYESDGSTLVYEFECVTDIVDNQDPAHYVEHETLRGTGSRIIPGSESAWDLPLSFMLIASGSSDADKYTDLTAKIDTVKNTIQKFTKYIFKVEKTQGGATEDYNVMRIAPISFPVSDTNLKRVTLQPVDMVLRVNCW